MTRIQWYEVIPLNPCELTLSVTALANAIAKDLSNDDVALLGSIFLQLGDTLTTISLQRSLCSKKNEVIPPTGVI